MSSLPKGRVTFLFTDIEGSTRLLEALGSRYVAMLAEHGRILRAAIEGHRGHEVNTEGDSFFAAFASAADAVAAAADIQRALDAAEWPEPVRVRIGLHTGKGELAGRDYIGLDVNRAARIAAAAHGGQVLLSATTAAEVEGGLPTAVSLQDLGEHRLKDLPGTEQLYQLVIDGLRSEFPPPRSLEIIPSNLPHELTPFFGRRTELADGQRLLGSARLVTLTGPGGSGKTRLAIRIAGASLAAFPDGVYFVPLAALRDPDLVLPEVARTLGLTEGVGLRERLLSLIGSRSLLLVLDNFEQLAPAAATVADLLSATPRLKVLVSSRSPLAIPGEREYPVPPLPVPDPASLPPLAELERSDAIALFVDRARAVRPGFELTAANAPTVARICARLDGLPLAIELAAARVKLLPVEAILARLRENLALLASSAPGVPERQRTLTGAIEWSYSLLTDEERTTFDCLGAFRGGATLTAVTRVMEASDELVILEQLRSLIDKSLVRRVDVETDLRVGMLETIHEFAAQRLAVGGDAERRQERHAVVFAELLEEAAPELQGSEGGRWLDRVGLEHDNVRAALDWAMATSRGDVAVRITAAAWRFWQMRGHLTEGRERAEQALRLSEDLDPILRARGLEAAGGLAYWQADFVSARERYQQALDLQRQIGDPPAVANALYNLSFAYFVSRDDPEQGRELAEQALAIYRSMGDRAGIASTLWALGGIENSFKEPRIDVARRHFVESRDLFEQLGNRRMLAWAHFMHAGAEMRVRNVPDAREALRQALPLFVELGDISGCTLSVRGLSAIEWSEGHRELATRLGAAADRMQRTTGVHLADWTSGQWGEWGGVEWSDRAEIEADSTLAAAWAAGQALEPQEAVAEALRLMASEPAATPVPRATG